MQIYYSTPFSTEKNIGKALNEFCELVPDDAWIVLRDMDTLFLRSDVGNQIEDIIKKNGEKYKLISCMTNRLRANHQLHNSRFSEDPNMNNHVLLANQYHLNWYDQVEATSCVAGLLMIFHKSTWEQVRFRENSILFDKEFNTDIRARFGGRTPIGIAKGLYVFHLYRWGAKDPYNSIEHLK